MQGIYNYIPETNHFSVLLWLQFMVHIMIFPMLKCSVPLHQHIPQYVCSAQYSPLLYFLHFLLFPYVTWVF
jgi:hypothetical protein